MGSEKTLFFISIIIGLWKKQVSLDFEWATNSRKSALGANTLSRGLCFQQSRRNRREKRKKGCSKKTDRSEGGGRRKARETAAGREPQRKDKREAAGRRSQMQLIRGEERITEVRPERGGSMGTGGQDKAEILGSPPLRSVDVVTSPGG